MLCLLFGIGIGLLMALLFWRDDASHDAQTDTLFAEQASIGPAAIGVLLSLVAVLIAGTLKLWPLTATVATVDLPLPWAEAWQATLFQWVPFDAAKGEEGVSVQGSLLIVLLLLIGADRLEGPGEHRRRRQPLDLDRAGPGRRHAAGGGAAADAARRRAGGRAHRPRAGGRRWRCGPCCTMRAGSTPTTGAPGCGKPGAS